VKPVVGDIAMDSADSAGEIYKQALERMGHDASALHPAAAKPIFNAWRAHGAASGRSAPRGHVAMDSAAARRREEMFPHANRLGR
jgi:hypothetical protein